VWSFEFSLDNPDARYTGCYRRGLRMRFNMIVHRLFCTCIVKGHNTGLKQWCDWRGYKGANLPPNKLNKKLIPYVVYISVCSDKASGWLIQCLMQIRKSYSLSFYTVFPNVRWWIHIRICHRASYVYLSGQTTTETAQPPATLARLASAGVTEHI